MLRSTEGDPASLSATANGAASAKMSTAGSAPLFCVNTETSKVRPTAGAWRQGELTAGAPRRCTNSSPSARTTIRTANPARYRTKTIGRDQPITGSTRCAGHIRKRCMRWKSPPVLRRGGAMVSPQNGRGATIFAKICASVAPGRTCSAARRRRALALQLAGGARRWPLSAAFEPIGHLWHVTEVDPRRPRPGQDARDIEVSDREMLAEEIGRVRDCRVEHHQRPAELVLVLIGQFRVALVLGQQGAVEQRGEQRPLDLGHAPEAPLPSERLILETDRVKAAARVFLGEIKVDRHRFAQHEPVIVDRRDVAVGVDLEKIGCALAAL